jgi:hypothetical protein
VICAGRVGAVFAIEASRLARNGRDKIEMDLDLRVGEAIRLVFARFAEMQSIRQVFLSLRADQIALPYIDTKSSGQLQLLWKAPVYATVNNLLTNPVYAGAYAFGRTGSRMTIENGRKRILRGRRKHRSDWLVLLFDHHEGYLSWADFERNQRLIADNADGKGMMVRGSVRKGEALLTGLLRCGHCGRRLLVSYNGTKGDIGRYHCDATRSNRAAASCISFGLCASTRRWGSRSYDCCSRWALKRRSVRSRNASTRLARNSANLNWRLNRHGSRPSGCGGNMMRSIRTIVLSRANSSGGGMPPSRP